MTMKRHLNLAFAVVLATPLVLVSMTDRIDGVAAQPTFRSGVALLTMDVTVLDGDGWPRAGLTPDDFEVELDGTRVPVRTLDYVSVAQPSYSAAPARTEVARQGPIPLTPDNRTRVVDRTYLMFVDDLSFGPLEHRALTAAAERFIAQLRLTDQVGLATSSGRSFVVPSRERSSVVRALRNVSGQFESPAVIYGTGADQSRLEMGLFEAVSIYHGDSGLARKIAEQRECREIFLQKEVDEERLRECIARVTARAYRIASGLESMAARQSRAWIAAATWLKQVDAARVLVVISGGLPFDLAGGAMREFSKAVVASGVSLHVVSSPRSSARAEDQTLYAMEMNARDDLYLEGGLRDAAAMGGGLFHLAVGQADDDFERVFRATSARYRLGVEMPQKMAPGQSMRTRVRVKARGVRVLAAAEYLAPGVPPVMTPDEQLRSIVRQGGVNVGVPLTVTPVVRRHARENALELGLHIEVGLETPMPLQVAFGIIGDGGRIIRSGRTLVERLNGGPTPTFSLAVPIPPGRYRVRVGVADSAGNIGSDDQAVNARLTEVGGVLTSQILVRAVADTGVSVVHSETVPNSATHVEVGMELYRTLLDGTDATREVQIALMADEGTVFQSRRVVLSAAESAWYAGIRVPLQDLPPGRIDVKFSVQEGGVTIASTGRRFWNFASGSAHTTPTDDAGRAADAPRIPEGDVERGRSVVLPSAADIRAQLQADATAAPPLQNLSVLLEASSVARHVVAMMPSLRTSFPPELSDKEFWEKLKGIERTGKGVSVALAKGIGALHQRDWAAARLRLEAVVEEAPEMTLAMLYLGVAHAGIGESREAAGAWALSLPVSEASVEWHLAFVDALVSEQDIEGALLALSEASLTWTAEPRLRLRSGELLLRKGRLAEAQRELDAAVALEPSLHRALLLRTGLAFADFLERQSVDTATVFETYAARTLAAHTESSSPVAEWRRVVSAAVKRPREE